MFCLNMNHCCSGTCPPCRPSLPVLILQTRYICFSILKCTTVFAESFHLFRLCRVKLSENLGLPAVFFFIVTLCLYCLFGIGFAGNLRGFRLNRVYDSTCFVCKRIRVYCMKKCPMFFVYTQKIVHTSNELRYLPE